LPNHPQYELAKKQMKGFSGMVCFWLKGGFDEAEIFLNKLQLFKNAASLGSVHSLAEHPSTLTHTGLSEEERQSLGITNNFIRLSIGLESADDLVQDLDQALKHA
uniref:cystathionine gamma-lyase n=1 Tax=Saccoglossus kowalevskii TaxID=10224 RepID=A0ABM0MF13_SACKO